MFDEISPSYDRLNHLLSGYQDNRWRKNAVNYLSSLSSNYKKILDLAAGSGDLGTEFLKLSPQKLYSVDLSFEMLKLNHTKHTSEINTVVKSDAQNLPFKDGFFDLCGIGFGVRNFEHLNECIIEINRVLKIGGKFVTIEMFKPDNPNIFNKLFKLYFEKILPKIGNSVSGSKYAYDYLFESVDNFLSVKNYTELLKKYGFLIKKVKNNFLGIVNTVTAEKNY